MPQIIIVSNRLPVTVKKVNGVLEFETSTGGVATGLASYAADRKNKWIGWPGIPSDNLSDDEKHQITTELGKHNCVPVFLSKKTVDDFYNGYSNSLLWPLFHTLPMPKAVSPETHERQWKAYRHVNKKFAEVTLSVAQPSSVIWVHDYQLMLLPEYLHTQLPKNHIGFFLHIPFPKPKVFAKLPEGTRLLRGIIGANLIGFHTKDYVQNFMDSVQVNDLAIGTPGQLILPKRTVRVTDFPMGIDYEKFAQASKLPAVKQAVKDYKQKYKGQKVIAAVDRLDISKGFVERLVAYRDFLLQNPKMIGRVTFVLVGAPSRTEVEAYQRLSKRVSKLASEINAQFSTKSWHPLDYIDEAIPFESVTALFQIADIAFIAPIRDGMNLVAKEFIASKHKNGVLILSESAGAAQELQDALLVDHRQPATLVAALEQAMGMSKREVRSRLKRMQTHLSTNTVQKWAGGFVQTLQKPVTASVGGLRTRTLSPKLATLITHAYTASPRRLLLLDYDGTLIAYTGNYRDAAPPERLMKILQKLSANKLNDVVLVSGRSADDLSKWFGNLPLYLVAEHGAMTKKAGSHTWHTEERAESKWKKTIQPVLEKYAAATPRARVEVKPHSLVWHYRQSPPYYAQKYVVIIKRVLKPLLKTYGLAVFQGNKILEIKNPRINKGVALERWLKSEHGFIMCIGDDYTDEDMFAALPPSAYSIKVGVGRTAAKFRLSDYKNVLDLLAKLSRQA